MEQRSENENLISIDEQSEESEKLFDNLTEPERIFNYLSQNDIKDYIDELKNNTINCINLSEIINYTPELLINIQFEEERITDKSLQKDILFLAIVLYNKVNQINNKDLSLRLFLLFRDFYKRFIEKKFPFLESESPASHIKVMRKYLASILFPGWGVSFEEHNKKYIFNNTESLESTVVESISLYEVFFGRKISYFLYENYVNKIITENISSDEVDEPQIDAEFLIESYHHQLTENQINIENINLILDNMAKVLEKLSVKDGKIEDEKLQRYIGYVAVNLFNRINEVSDKNLTIKLFIVLNRVYQPFTVKNLPYPENQKLCDYIDFMCYTLKQFF